MRIMKKILIFLSLLLLQSTCISSVPTYADDLYYYAKIEKGGTFLYASADESSPLFELPESYFVLLTDKANDKFYNATYLDKTGYVKISEVTPMQGQPNTPFASATFRVFSINGLGLYKSPSLQSAGLITNVPYLTSTINYYGKIEGESIPNKSNVWYYCKFIEPASTYQGYLYSVFCDELSPIIKNQESFPLITSPLFPQKGSGLGGLSDTAKTFIILGVSLPCALIIYLLIKPTLSGQKQKVKKKKPRRRHGDYFEFDENDLT